MGLARCRGGGKATVTSVTSMPGLIPPYGGTLTELLVDAGRAAALRAAARDWPSWTLTPRQLADVELLLNGGFSPLSGFMARADYESVCQRMRLANGTLWPIPITLDVPEGVADGLQDGDRLALRDLDGTLVAALRVEEVWSPDLEREAQAVYGTTDGAHPGVVHLRTATHPRYVGGRLEGLQLPAHYDFVELRHTPSSLRQEFLRRGWARIVAFQTRNAMHRAHYELTVRAAAQAGAHLLIHPVVGLSKPGDVDHFTRVRCYKALLPTYPAETTILSLLPLAMRMAGPREAVWHAIIRRNYGCTHLIVGRDHAGPGADSTGRPFYGPNDAQALLASHAGELGLTPVCFPEVVYVEALGRYLPADEVPSGARPLSLSGSEVRARLARGAEIPSWYTPPAVAEELARSYPPRDRQGCTIFFTGLSGSGKSTIAHVLQMLLLEIGGRRVSVLDGDLVRRLLSSGLGFSRADRDLNIQRIGFVAAEITKNGGFAICAPIAPFDATRKEVRRLVESVGGFVLVHLATALHVCEARDRKGLYSKARAGLVEEFTGISSPYEAPADAEIVIDTETVPAAEAAARIVGFLRQEGYLHPE